MVGLQILDLPIGVRVPASQPSSKLLKIKSRKLTRNHRSIYHLKMAIAHRELQVPAPAKIKFPLVITRAENLAPVEPETYYDPRDASQ